MHQRRLLVAFITLALATGYFYLVLPMCTEQTRSCIGGWTIEATAPARYRVLQPALETLIAPNTDPFTTEILWPALLLQMAFIVGTIPVLYVWFTRWANADAAVFGVFIFGAMYLFAYSFYYRVLSTSIEIMLVVWTLVLMRKPRIVLLSIITIVAAFNRETGLLIPAIYAAYYADQWRSRAFQITTVWYVGLWAAVTIGLRLVLGSAPHMLGGLEGTFVYNLDNLPDALISNLLVIPLALAILISFRLAPAPLKRLALVAGIYFVAILVGAAWNETRRLVLPLLPLLIPLLILPKGQTDTASQAKV